MERETGGGGGGKGVEGGETTKIMFEVTIEGEKIRKCLNSKRHEKKGLKMCNKIKWKED